MKKLYFFPPGYLENKEFKRKNLIKTLIIVFFILDIILMDFHIFNVSKLKIIDNEIKQKSSLQKNLYHIKNKSQSKNNKTLDTFLALTDNILPNIDFKSVYIENRSVDINLGDKTIDCISLINNIEKDNRFIVKNITNIGEFKDGERLKINLELK